MAIRPYKGEWPFAPTECFALTIFSAMICLRSCFAPTGICGLLAEKIAVIENA